MDCCSCFTSLTWSPNVSDDSCIWTDTVCWISDFVCSLYSILWKLFFTFNFFCSKRLKLFWTWLLDFSSLPSETLTFLVSEYKSFLCFLCFLEKSSVSDFFAMSIVNFDSLFSFNSYLLISLVKSATGDDAWICTSLVFVDNSLSSFLRLERFLLMFSVFSAPTIWIL